MMMTLSCQSSFRGGCGRVCGFGESIQKSLARKTAPHDVFLWRVFVARGSFVLQKFPYSHVRRCQNV